MAARILPGRWNWSRLTSRDRPSGTASCLSSAMACRTTHYPSKPKSCDWLAKALF